MTSNHKAKNAAEDLKLETPPLWLGQKSNRKRFVRQFLGRPEPSRVLESKAWRNLGVISL